MSDWYLVNLIFPALLPVMLLSVLFLFNLSKPLRHKANPIVAIKDGQLCWAGLGMCMNGLYELRHSQSLNISDTWAVSIFWFLLLTLLLLTLIAALVPLFSTPIKSKRSSLWGIVIHYRVLMVSAVLTAFAAFLYSNIHFSIEILETA